MGDNQIETTSRSTPSNPAVTSTLNDLLGGVQNIWKGGPATFEKSLYGGVGDTTRGAWQSTISAASNPQWYSGVDKSLNYTNDLLTGRGLTGNAGSGQQGDLSTTRNLGGQYGQLGSAYTAGTPGIDTLRSKVQDDTMTGVNSVFGGSGRLGSDLHMKSAGEGLGNALAGFDYSNYQNDINNRYRSLDSQAGQASTAFGMEQQGVQNAFGAASALPSILQTAFMPGQALGAVGAAQDADKQATLMGQHDLFRRQQDARVDLLAKLSSILGGTAGAGGMTTTNTEPGTPWWQSAIGLAGQFIWEGQMGLTSLLLGEQNPVSQYVANNKNTIRGAFAGFGQGRNFSEGLGRAALGAYQGGPADDAYATSQKAEAERQRQIEATVAEMRKYSPQIADIVATGSMDPTAGWNQILTSMSPKEQPLMSVGEGSTVFDPNTRQPVFTAPGTDGMVINNNMGGTDKFYDALDTEGGKQQMALINEGMNAQSNNARLTQLEQHLATAPQGAQGVMVQVAGSLGIPMEGLDDVQAAQALINQMVPGQRPPGSGTMSDADLALFKQSLPSIVNQPGGNQYIIQTAKAINEYTIALAEIATMVANREISPAEGRQMQASLPNPLADLKRAVPTPAPGGGGYKVIGVR